MGESKRRRRYHRGKYGKLSRFSTGSKSNKAIEVLYHQVYAFFIQWTMEATAHLTDGGKTIKIPKEEMDRLLKPCDLNSFVKEKLEAFYPEDHEKVLLGLLSYAFELTVVRRPGAHQAIQDMDEMLNLRLIDIALRNVTPEVRGELTKLIVSSGLHTLHNFANER